ncbi:MAG: PspA/IM30 family protein [Bryobacteraceae bacterium]
MALLERVATLVRANLNDLIDKAENPEKMIKQVILDMQNQLMQVKTQVAIAIADQHLLSKKQKENEASAAEWVRKAELAVEKKQDDLARPAIDRSLSYKQMAAGFLQQLDDQSQQVENLKTALNQLELKLNEAQAKSDLLIAQHRRARALGKATDARAAMGGASHAATFDRMRDKVLRTEAIAGAKAELAGDSLNDRLLALGKDDEIEMVLQQIKTRKGITG